MGFLGFVRSIGTWAKRAFDFARSRGLNDQMINLALTLVMQASGEATTTNEQKREWVVHQLMFRGIPESVARLALELAIQLWKKQQAVPS